MGLGERMLSRAEETCSWRAEHEQRGLGRREARFKNGYSIQYQFLNPSCSRVHEGCTEGYKFVTRQVMRILQILTSCPSAQKVYRGIHFNTKIFNCPPDDHPPCHQIALSLALQGCQIVREGLLTFAGGSSK